MTTEFDEAGDTAMRRTLKRPRGRLAPRQRYWRGKSKRQCAAPGATYPGSRVGLLSCDGNQPLEPRRGMVFEALPPQRPGDRRGGDAAKVIADPSK